MEGFYGFEREIDLRDAGSSIVAFEEWLELGDGERPGADHLDRIERYNRDDVVSNQRLRDWLELLRDELATRSGLAVPRPGARAPLPESVSDEFARTQELVDRLADPEIVPTDPADRAPEQHGRWLLAQLLGWHRREDKATWWEFFRQMDLTPEQLVDEDDPIGLLEPVGPVGEPVKGRQVWRYGFPEQEFDLGRLGNAFEPRQKAERPDDNPYSWTSGEVVALDPVELTVDVKRDPATQHPEAIVALPVVPTPQHRARLRELGEWVAEHGMDGPGPGLAARNLLMGRPPRAGQAPGARLRRDDETDLQAARRLALALDATVLPIQGPPGSGKTYGGARMIVSLLAAGRRVGITATSHKVICNLLSETLAAAHDEGIEISAVQRGDADQVLVHERVTRARDPGAVRSRLDDREARLAAGTSWLWTAGAMRDAVDVLFVDEAGQVSLANVIAMAGAATSIVLLGDPQQLDQPMQGSHPSGADRSALAHVLGTEATILPDRGLFLETTWRLHPVLCRFTSEVFYDDRLEPEPHLAIQAVRSRDERIDGVGPRRLDVIAKGAENVSPAEADAVAELARAIVGSRTTWVDHHGVTRPVGWDDVLIVAPYNAQVSAITRRLPDGARVGTVDKFQGQQAPISIYSLTTSTPELAPRGMDFLYSRHRLNVATSRARCIAVVVASPDLLRVRARTPEQMRLANALCRFAELAAAPPPARGGGTAPAALEILTLGLE
jgi:uncharacterized protein